MKNKKLNAVQVWKEFEDVLAPRLRWSVIDRAVYSHLLRHSRIEGKFRLQFSIIWLAEKIRLTCGPVRDAVRRLIEQKVLRLIERSNLGHLVEVRLPDEVRAASIPRIASGGPPKPLSGASLDKVDFLQTRARRQLIHARERGMCFYCLRRIPSRLHCLDHVVPRAKFGRNSYRNLVSCCLECNSRKRHHSAGDLLRSLFREGRLSVGELHERLRALHWLAAGKLRPAVQMESNDREKDLRSPRCNRKKLAIENRK
jgi:5-methylcytosine-specific restriction endonuclease McrA